MIRPGRSGLVLVRAVFLVVAAEPSVASRAIAFDGKTCHLCLCCDSDDGPGYDLWHVLFECLATINHPAVVGLRTACQCYVAKLCNLISAATEANSCSMSNTKNSGVDHLRRFWREKYAHHMKLSNSRTNMIGTVCRQMDDVLYDLGDAFLSQGRATST